MGASAARPFRFGAFLQEGLARPELERDARRLASMGFTDLLVADHFGADRLDPFLTLQIAADATADARGPLGTAPRVGTMVACNDFRHPALLAKQAATLDRFSGGRFDLGIGAGWIADEFAQLGLTLDPAATRIARLEASVDLIGRLLNGTRGSNVHGPVSFESEYHRIVSLVGPAPIQRPVPILVGGGAPRILRAAGRHAHIVSFMARSVDGWIDAADITWKAIAEKIGWVREAAGDRFAEITLSGLVQDVVLTSDRRQAARAYLDRARAGSFPLTMRHDLSEDDVLGSPLVLLGRPDEIVEHLRHVRDELGISYFCGLPAMDEPLAEVIAALS